MISNLGLISETVSGIYNKTLTRTYTTAFGKGKVLSMSIGNVNNYTYDYDTYGRLNKIATLAGDFTYTRPSDSDLVTAMARPNNVTSNWTFEVHRNLLSQVANGSVSTYAYTNDALGRRTNVTRSGSAFSDTNILTYGYNSRSEVISALSNINANYNFAYSYDPIGNRLNSTLAGTAWNYTSNNLNQYTALTSGNTTQSPAYDADGNMTFRDGWTQVWNGENRLVEMYNDTTKLTFSYDYMGRRIEKKVFQQTGGIWAPQKSLQYVYDGYKLVEEIDTLPDEKPVIRRYTWQPESQGADLPLVVTDVASNQSYFYTADGNKNISELVDAAGNIAAHYEYEPFGKITTQNGAYAVSNPFRFSSEYFDDETGLVYYNYRYYSPQMGRWINRDPIGEEGGWNLYAMVGNNIINRSDKLGYAWVTKSCTTQSIPFVASAYYKVGGSIQFSVEMKKCNCCNTTTGEFIENGYVEKTIKIMGEFGLGIGANVTVPILGQIKLQLKGPQVSLSLTPISKVWQCGEPDAEYKFAGVKFVNKTGFEAGGAKYLGFGFSYWVESGIEWYGTISKNSQTITIGGILKGGGHFIGNILFYQIDQEAFEFDFSQYYTF